MSARIAILDVGKTHSRLALIDTATCRELWGVRRTNARIATPHGLQLDVAAIEAWLLGALAQIPGKESLTAIVPIAHGAAAVLVDNDGLVLTAPDYEDPRFDTVATEYAALREPFALTLSPSLPLGLNLGRQLYYLERHEPQLLARARHALLYPQFWAWKLCGVPSSEVTSLGCHTDLWRPASPGYSMLVSERGWQRLLPPLEYAGEPLGPISPSLARATGIDPSCRVICGIHDSNASYLQHLLHYPREQPFTVLSSGTWTVLMSSHVDLSRLDAARDMLANVDAFARPVATARFMGGREYEAIAHTSVLPDFSSVMHVIDGRAFALPSFAPAGPFPDRDGRIVNGANLRDVGRAALATLYVALMTDLSLESLDITGDLLIDGPLARNPVFASVLAALRPACRVALVEQAASCARAATYLAGLPLPEGRVPHRIAPVHVDGLSEYRAEWRGHVTT